MPQQLKTISVIILDVCVDEKRITAKDKIVPSDDDEIDEEPQQRPLKVTIRGTTAKILEVTIGDFVTKVGVNEMIVEGCNSHL